jgi:hypothetical protein
VKFLKQSGIDPQTAGIEAYCKPQTETVQLVLDDLMFLREAHIQIDDETFMSVLLYENMHRDFTPCSGCSVTTFGQHDPLCRHASVLWLPEWFDIIQAREEDR